MSASAAAQKGVARIQGRSVIDGLPTALAKRAVQSQRQAARRSKARFDAAMKANKWNAVAERKRVERARLTNLANQRRWLREDHAMGPLAPRRDVGPKAHTFGASEVETLNGPEKRKPKLWGIVPGDRVVVVKPGHRDRGRIAKVREIRESREEVTVENVNVSDIAVPEYMLIREEDKTPVRPFEFPMPLSWVRLVAPIPDPTTGQVKDMVIQELKLSRITRRELKGVDPPTRSIAGVDPPVYIPYPEAEEEDAEEHGGDTLRIEVENRTWTPTLRMPPMPPDVLDELRNRFSRFRFRHDDDYVQAARRGEEDAHLRRRQRSNLMLTPLKQRRRRERLERKSLGAPQLSDESLAAIGEVMERNMNSRVEGVEKLVSKA